MITSIAWKLCVMFLIACPLGIGMNNTISKCREYMRMRQRTWMENIHEMKYGLFWLMPNHRSYVIYLKLLCTECASLSLENENIENYRIIDTFKSKNTNDKNETDSCQQISIWIHVCLSPVASRVFRVGMHFTHDPTIQQTKWDASKSAIDMCTEYHEMRIEVMPWKLSPTATTAIWDEVRQSSLWVFCFVFVSHT